MAVFTTQVAELSVVEVCLPGKAPEAVGVILTDPATGDYRLRFRRDWNHFAGEEAEVLELLAEQFDDGLHDEGLDWLTRCEDALSNTVRITDREQVTVGNLDRDITRLYNRHVRSEVLEFRTHLPLFSARVAAGRFLEGHEVHQRDWIETPPELRLTKDMFVVEITGRSMEPTIPDGSLCVFRHEAGGSRDGRLLLIERLDLDESNGRYTVKRYTSQKARHGDEWRHKMILLEPLNREFDAWELDPDEHLFRVIGEFVRVLD